MWRGQSCLLHAHGTEDSDIALVTKAEDSGIAIELLLDYLLCRAYDQMDVVAALAVPAML